MNIKNKKEDLLENFRFDILSEIMDNVTIPYLNYKILNNSCTIEHNNLKLKLSFSKDNEQIIIYEEKFIMGKKGFYMVDNHINTISVINYLNKILK